MRRLRRECTFLIAAAGGANTARKYGLTPDVIIGDLDSVLPGTRRAFRESLLLHLSRQDNTDLEKALDGLTASNQNERADSRPLAEMFPVFLLLLVILGTEWVIRRRTGLD